MENTGTLSPAQLLAKNNPYQCCAYCKVSDPVINGSLENHLEWCEYRQNKERQEELELLRLEIECLKLDLQKPVYCVARGWSSEFSGGGEDMETMKVFRDEEKALAHKAELEADPTFDLDSNYVEIVQKFVR
jgi:hypothetical protein